MASVAGTGKYTRKKAKDELTAKGTIEDFLGSPAVKKSTLSLKEVQIQSLMGELRSHTMQPKKKKKKTPLRR